MKRVTKLIKAVLYGLAAIFYDFNGSCGVKKEKCGCGLEVNHGLRDVSAPVVCVEPEKASL